MLIRVFRASVRPGAEADYDRILREVAIPSLQRQPGLVALHVGHGLPSSIDEYVMVSVWKDFEAMKAWTGDDWWHAVVYPGEARLVTESHVDHFETF